MRFHEAIAAIAREAMAGEHASCLLAARALKARLLAEQETDPSELGWARYYEIHALYHLGRFAEGVAVLSTDEPRPALVRSDNAAWLAQIEAEMASALGDLTRTHAGLEVALRLHLEEQDLVGTFATLEAARGLLLRVGAPERFGGMLDALDRLLEEAEAGSPAAERAAAVIQEVERSEWGRHERRVGRRGLGLLLREAALRGDLARVEELLGRGADANALDGANPGLCRPLLAASAQGHVAVVERLLCAGARPELPNVQGRTPLHLAADQGHAETVLRLVQAGAPREAKDLFGQTPLHLAGWQSHGDVVERLLAAGADPNAADASGCTPLHLMASEPLPELVERLIAAGADVNARDLDEATPLMHAAAEGRADCAERLIAGGARLDLQDEDGRSAADVAFANGHLLLGRRLSSGTRPAGSRARLRSVG